MHSLLDVWVVGVISEVILGQQWILHLYASAEINQAKNNRYKDNNIQRSHSMCEMPRPRG